MFNQELPETFTDENREAAPSSATWSELGEGQEPIRVEDLDFALTNTSVTSLADLDRASRVRQSGRDDPSLSVGDAREILDVVRVSLNRNPNAVRPRFAAFARELLSDINDDWANRLRDRLGLAHLPPTAAFGPHPVALMRCAVKRVRERADKLRATFPLAVPTVLDAEPYEIFTSRAA